MLTINDCTFRYSKRKPPVIDRFSLSLSEGGVYGLLGSNGAGKSTLLNLIAGLLTPDSGDVTLDGINTRRRLPVTLSEIFLVPEEFDLPSMPLETFARVNGALYPRFSHEDFIANLETFSMTPDQNLGALSMGQKKKVFLSFAMACNTKLVLLDEPTNGLDIPGKTAFRRFIARAMTDDRIFIISTHQVRDVGQILDHVLIVDNHEVILDQPVAEIERRLQFVDTFDKELIARALYSEKALGGASVIIPADGDEESRLNLELLFNFAHTDAVTLKSIFK